MRSFILAGLLAAGSAHALSDSSPFLLFSTAEYVISLCPSVPLSFCPIIESERASHLRDSAPIGVSFVLLMPASPHRFPSAHQPSQLQTSSRVLSAAKDILSQCPTTNYLLVSQANAHASDLDGPEGCGVHRIRSAVTGDDVRGRYTVAEVVNSASGNMTFEGFSEHIKKSCLEKGSQEANVRQLSLTPLPASRDCKARAETMDDNGTSGRD